MREYYEMKKTKASTPSPLESFVADTLSPMLGEPNQYLQLGEPNQYQ